MADTAIMALPPAVGPALDKLVTVDQRGILHPRGSRGTATPQSVVQTLLLQERFHGAPPADLLAAVQQWVAEELAARVVAGNRPPPILSPHAQELVSGLYWPREGPLYVRAGGVCTPNEYRFEGNPVRPADLFKIVMSQPHARDLEARYVRNIEDTLSRWELGQLDYKGHVPAYSTYFAQCVWPLIHQIRVHEREPVQISNSPDVACVKYIDLARVDAARGQPTPAWDAFLGQMPEHMREPFLAWWWGVVDPGNTGRQGMWLHDNGFTGKSQVAAALARFLGGACAAVGHGLTDRPWFFSSVYGARLVVFGDCKDPHFLNRQACHALLGGDMVQIEKKYEQPFSARIHARILVMSNVPPETRSYRVSDTSRVICAELTPADGPHRDGLRGDGGYGDRLYNEMWPLLARAREVYARHCPSGCNVVLPAEYDPGSDNAEELAFDTFTGQNIEFTDSETDVVTPGELLARFQASAPGAGVRGSLLYGEYRAYLVQKHARTPVRPWKDRRRVYTRMRLRPLNSFIGVPASTKGTA